MRRRDLVDVFSIDFGVLSECESNFLVKGVDEEVKKLVFVDSIVCLLGFRHTFCKQASQVTGFVMYWG
jgi:hypothetical protein